MDVHPYKCTPHKNVLEAMCVGDIMEEMIEIPYFLPIPVLKVCHIVHIMAKLVVKIP